MTPPEDIMSTATHRFARTFAAVLVAAAATLAAAGTA